MSSEGPSQDQGQLRQSPTAAVEHLEPTGPPSKGRTSWSQEKALRLDQKMSDPLLRSCRNLVLQVLTKPLSDLVGVLVSMHGHRMLRGGHDDFTLFTRNRQRAIAVAWKVAAISNFSAHASP